jgi:hypothetical protein
LCTTRSNSLGVNITKISPTLTKYVNRCIFIYVKGTITL